MKKIFLFGLVAFSQHGYAQNYIDNYLSGTVTNTIIGTSSNGVSAPRDLDFKPNSNELWVANYGNSNGAGISIFYNAGEADQSSEYRRDSHSGHFIIYPSAIAFGDNGRWASTNEIKNTANASSTFMGPALWSGDTAIFASVFQNNWEGQKPLGSHIDMLHQSPFAMGVAHDSLDDYWVFDGHNGNICKYSFVEDHGPGYDDHSQGEIWRYTDISVTRQAGVPSHMVKDKTTGWLYFVDGGSKELKRMNTTTGSVTGTLTPPPTGSEPLIGYWNVTGATLQTLDSFSSSQPSGIDLYNGRLIVGDYATGDIYIYDVTGTNPVKLGKVSTGLPGIQGIKIGPDGKIWVVNNTLSRVYRLDPNSQAVNDASVVKIITPQVNNFNPDFYSVQFNQCAGDIAPQITLRNNGSSQLKSVTISLEVDNVLIDTVHWVGTLASGAETIVSFSNQSIASGNHKISFFTSSPNGLEDENPANDRKDGGFRVFDDLVPYPLIEDFDGPDFPPAGWAYVHFNPNNHMERIPNIGGFGNSLGSVKMDNYSRPMDITGQIDYLITPRIDMSDAANISELSFSVAYAQFNASSKDQLAVKYSIDCGETWTEIYKKSGNDLATTSFNTSAYTPSLNEWRTERIPLANIVGNPDVLFLFETTSGYGNNLFLDDIKMQNSTSIESVSNNLISTVYPNPSNGKFNVEVSSTSTNINVKVYDMLGKLIESSTRTSTKFSVDLSKEASGFYYLVISTNQGSSRKKISLIK